MYITSSLFIHPKTFCRSLYLRLKQKVRCRDHSAEEVNINYQNSLRYFSYLSGKDRIPPDLFPSVRSPLWSSGVKRRGVRFGYVEMAQGLSLVSLLSAACFYSFRVRQFSRILF